MVTRGDLMEKRKYVCSKCGCLSFSADQFQIKESMSQKPFDKQNKTFITISCTLCGHTEIYNSHTSVGWNILDFLCN